MKKFLLLSFFCLAILSCKNSSIVEANFENNSFVVLDKYTNQNIEDLYLLCKVWGFMRFHHPSIVQGNQNWDYELFRIIPLVLNSTSKDERNKIIYKWIKAQGKVKPQSKEPIFDNIKIVPDFSWIQNPELGDVAKELIKIKNAEKDFYPYYEQDNILLLDSLLKEEAYADLPSFPDVGYRLLTLFRYWNIIEYFFPYKYLIGEDWDKILLDFIPQFINVGCEVDYRMLILKLVASTNDSHSQAIDPILYKHIGRSMAPMQASYIEGKAVVTITYNGYKSLKKGDVIVAINDNPIDSIVEYWLPYTPASNYPTKLRSITLNLFITNDSKLKIAFERNGAVKTDSVSTYSIKNLNDHIVAPNNPNIPLCQMIDNNILYIYVGSKEGGTIPDKIEAKGIVIDMRCYPNFDVKGFDFSHLYPQQVTTARIVVPKLPGLFSYNDSASTIRTGENNPNYFKGKKVIIINEQTQSAAEFLTMRLQYAPNTVVIGSNTAGADGDTFWAILPGNIRIKFSGFGVYYPDGRETQRIGIVPDIEVKPTIKGIREGRDELLEKAILIINEDS